MDIQPGRIINNFIDLNKVQYQIPVYQRNYEWAKEQCKKLFDDVLLVCKNGKTHFCGSIVYKLIKEEHNINYYVIIDGQQRITTIYILIKVLLDLAENDSAKDAFTNLLINHDKFDEFAIEEQSKLKLKAVESDNNQLIFLMSGKEDKIDKSSGIWQNYEYFKKLVSEAQKKQITTKDIFRGLEQLTCARISLDKEDNAQEIFERINSTGIPLSLADKIRNFILMTDENQEELYKNYWLEIEDLIEKNQMPNFFQDYLNLKIDGFAKDNTAYDIFKDLYRNGKYTNESMLQEMFHYAKIYHAFLYGDSKTYSEQTNKALEGLRKLKQTTVYLFLFSVFDDFENHVINEDELNKVLSFILSYSIRRLICDVASNSLRGFYKTLYSRVYSNNEHIKTYYDSLVSFMLQLNTKDAIPDDTSFKQSLIYNNLYRKNALCKYLLAIIENQGKEILDTSNLTIEHIMPQNKDISEDWKKMLGDNWEADKEKYLHTLGNLTLTAYNSELGDKKFSEKLDLLDDKKTKIVILYQDVKSCSKWDADSIETRAKNLSKTIFDLFPIEKPTVKVSFATPGYKEYSLANPEDAAYKRPNYYVLQGERVNCNSFALMLITLSKRLYNQDSSILEKIAKENLHFVEGKYASFSYDLSQVNMDTQIEGTDIYISHNYNSPKIVRIISQLLAYYEIDQDDFIYSACSTDMKKEDEGEE